MNSKLRCSKKGDIFDSNTNNQDSTSPQYEKELDIFQKETLSKIKEFRAARSNWITSSANQTINADQNEDLNKTNLYKGSFSAFEVVKPIINDQWNIKSSATIKNEIPNFRCSCLRRIGFKTTFLRTHYKTVRPFKFHGLKRKFKNKLIKHKLPLGQKRKKKIYLQCIKRKVVFTNSTKKTATRLKTIFNKKNKIKKRKKSKQKMKKRVESSKKRFKPSKEAIKRLKAAKLENTDMEPFTCHSENEFEAVVKGSCPNVKLKPGEESSSVDESIDFETPVCSTKDSLEFVKKTIKKPKTCQKNLDFKARLVKLCKKKLYDKKFKKEMKDEGEESKTESLDTSFKNTKKYKSVGLTKEELIKMGRMCEETIIIEL